MYKLSLYFLSTLLLLIAGAGLWEWYRPKSDKISIVRVPEVRYIAQSEIPEGKIPTVTLPCKQIEALKPSSRDTKALEKLAKGPIPAGDLLAVKKIEPLPYGGSGFITLGPSTQAGGGDITTLTIIPRQAPFFEWIGERSVGIYAGLSTGGDSFSLDLQRTFSIEFKQSLLRTGPAIWEIKVGSIWFPYSQLKDNNLYYAMFGTKVKF